jgi:hypothetical protein
MNPDYLNWGPYEDYMHSPEGQGWDTPVFPATWDDFGPWNLDDLNEVVNFYFEINRESMECPACKGECYNPETTKIAQDYYDFAGTGRRWVHKITQDEVEALVKAGRLWSHVEERCHFDKESEAWFKWEDGKKVPFDGPEMPRAEKVNADHTAHDAINRSILIRTRAKRLGVWGRCETCEGNGVQYTEPEAHLGLVLWFLHPRKGCSRGVQVERIEKDEMVDVVAYLQKAADRNTQRFGRLRQA